MKERMKILGEYLYFMFVCVPVFCIVMTMVYVGFFILDIYKLFKKIIK